MRSSYQGATDVLLDLSIVAPVFNEQDTIVELVRRTADTCNSLGKSWELVLVDDGSADDSLRMIEGAIDKYAPHVKCIVLAGNFGQHAAIMAGFQKSSGAVIVTLDADLQNPPEEIARLLVKMDDGFDVVGGVRSDRNDSLFRRAASAIVNRAARMIGGSTTSDHGCMLRAYRRPIVNAMLQCTERSTFIPLLANVFARRTADVPVEHAARSTGQSKYGLWQLINLQFDLMTSVTTLPLRLLGVLGVAIAFGATGFGALIAIMRFVLGSEWAANGVFSLFSVLFFLIGLQFVAMGVLGEYLGRVYGDVRARPRYIVSDVLESDGAPPSTVHVKASSAKRMVEAGR